MARVEGGGSVEVSNLTGSELSSRVSSVGEKCLDRTVLPLDYTEASIQP